MTAARRQGEAQDAGDGCDAQELRRRCEALEAQLAERTRQLRESEARLERVFASSPVAILLTRLPDGLVVDANAAAAELFGTPVERLRGLRAPELWVDPAQREAWLDVLRYEGRAKDFRAQLRRPGGGTFWGSVTGQLSEEAGHQGVLVSVRDVTGEHLAEERLQQSYRTLHTLFSAAPLPLVLTRMSDGVIRACNERAAAMFEAPVADVVGRAAPDFYADPGERELFVERLRAEGRVEGLPTRLRTRAGRPFWVLLSAMQLRVEDEEMFMVGFADFSEQKSLEDSLRTLATTDGLTGALTRAHFFELAHAELVCAARAGRRLAVAMVDADHFKAINDAHGHAVGDEVLQLLGSVVRGVLRRSDLFARYGGEELIVLLPDASGDEAEAAMERLREAVRRAELVVGDARVRVTVSVGVAEAVAGEELAALVKRADAALYAAKRAGRDRVVRATGVGT